MRYVDRDPVTNEVISTFACQQRPRQEKLEDNHPDILVFQAKRDALQAMTRERMRILNEIVDAKIEANRVQ